MAAAEVTNFFRHCRKIIGLVNNIRMPNVTAYPAEPTFFLKAPTTMIKEGTAIKVPTGFEAVNYEVELGVIIGKDGSNIAKEDALDYIGGYCLTLDMTSMDKVKEAGAKGMPWTLGKNWDTFTPVSDVIPKESIPDPHGVGLWLKLDGEVKSNGNTRDLVFDIPTIISHSSKIMTLQAGDVFLTGAPGNGLCGRGQTIECGLEGIRSMKFTLA